MTRTPLLGALRRLTADHAAALASGRTLDDVRAQRPGTSAESEERISRRAFLKGTAALTTALAMPRLARARGDAEIAIVGAGISGLTAALMLADRRVPATVYEASGRAGGRMFSNNGGFWRDGQVSEWGGELIDSAHRTIRHLARRFRLHLTDLHAAEPAGSEEIYFFGGRYYPASEVDADFAPVFLALTEDLDAAGYPTTWDSSTPQGRALDAMSIYDWIESRVPGGHASRLGQLLDVAYDTEYGADTSDQSALNLVYLLGFQPSAKRFALYGESDERFHISGGNQRLPQAIAEHLGVGERVKFGYRLVRIARTPGGRIQLAFAHGGRTIEIVADIAVLALPFAVLRGLDYSGAGFDARKDQAIQELGRGHNGKLQLQFASRPWNGLGPWPGISNGSSFADTGYQGGWDVTRGQDGASGILNHYLGGSVADSFQVKAGFGTSSAASVRTAAHRVLKQIEPVFPGLSPLWNDKATLSLPHLSPFFNCSYSYWRVGQYQTIAGYEAVPQGNVLFAGEHTSINFQGFMEGAAAEGARAAKEVLRLLRARA